MSEGWKVERVEIQRPEDRDPQLYREALWHMNPEDAVRCVLFGRMDDGRAFYNEQWIPVENFDAVGEEQIRADMIASAQPPEDDQ